MDVPDTEAEVIEVKPNVFKILYSRSMDVSVKRPSIWDGEVNTVQRITSPAGIKFESTYPFARQWAIDWENPWMTVHRIRTITPDDIFVIRALDDASIGKQYDVSQFVTFGNLRLPNANICSEIGAMNPYLASIAVNALKGLDRAPIVLTPDIKGMFDPFITPNDLLNSGMLYKITHQGVKDVPTPQV
jgi:hypothetical protein